MELDTYRYRGHSQSDPGTRLVLSNSLTARCCLVSALWSYHGKEEVDNVKAFRDPIQLCKERILEKDLATADELKVCQCITSSNHRQNSVDKTMK